MENQERIQLEAYHSELAAKNSEAQSSFLLNGYLPDDGEVLVEAGIRCLPLIHSHQPGVSDAAVHRLQAVLFKLEQNPQDEKAQKAIGEFKKVLKDYHQKSDADARYGLGAILLLSVILGLVLYFLIRLFV